MEKVNVTILMEEADSRCVKQPTFWEINTILECTFVADGHRKGSIHEPSMRATTKIAM